MKTYGFSIADVSFQMVKDSSFNVTNHFEPFTMNYRQNSWNLSYKAVSNLPNISGNKIYQSDEYSVFEEEDGIYFVYRNIDSSEIYAVSKINYESKKSSISYFKEADRFFNETDNCFFHSQWERIMIEENRLILHASCIETAYGGILFSGRSGIGKSTQSDLWIENENAKLINGDRPILGKKKDQWFAYGSPYAGSSRCHINESAPVRCIVLLDQEKENRLRKLSIKEAFHRVYRNITVNTWDKEFVSKSLDLTLELVSSIPVYGLSCLPDQSAVECLKEELEKESDKPWK